MELLLKGFLLLSFLLFCYFLISNWKVDYFRKKIRKGRICTFYIDEIRWIGEIVDYFEGVAKIQYFDGSALKETQRPLQEIYP